MSLFFSMSSFLSYSLLGILNRAVTVLSIVTLYKITRLMCVLDKAFESGVL